MLLLQDPTRRNAALLAVAQALMQTGTSLVLTVGALVGNMLAATPVLATLPLSLMMIATMLTTIPASLMMQRLGRRAGFTLGAALGATGGVLAAYAIIQGNFWLFAAGSMLWGMFTGFGGFYRFAAADSASPEFRPRAISLVMTGGVVAAIFGPSLARVSRDWLLPYLFAGSYLVVAALAAISVLVLQTIRIAPPPKPTASDGPVRSLAEIFAQPAVLASVVAAALGYAIMSLVMTATPLAMLDCGFDFGDTATVIQWHVLGMFVPSFFTGRLIARFGERTILTIGALLTAGCAVANLAGIEFGNFLAGLLLLGVGWNFLYVGGSALFARLILPTERGKAQAAFDFTVFSCVSAASLAAGLVQNTLGWFSINMGVLPLMVIVLGVVLVKTRQAI